MGTDDLRTFHVVLVLAKVETKYTKIVTATIKQYKRIAQQIATALRYIIIYKNV